MPGPRNHLPISCVRCLRAQRFIYVPQTHARAVAKQFSRLSSLQSTRPTTSEKVEDTEDAAAIEDQILNPKGDTSNVQDKPEQGAMSRLLQEATEEALFEGGRAGRKAVEDAGFSEDLKQRLLEKVSAARFKSDNAVAFVEADIGDNVGRGSRDIATGQAWTGFEAPADSVLRMLNDAHKPLKPGTRGPAKIPSPVVDMRFKREVKQKPGDRLATARDKTSIYAISKDPNLSEKEREDMRRELKERFSPGARSMPSTIRGLEALANERIEDAIARGQFKNIPRGKAIERDPRADNPFIDTTEYIMNKMIQRQDIVPPWIEKQQELVKTASIFRARLRNDWKRIASRTIASRGGSLQEQMNRADVYAASEKAYNPKKKSVEQIAVPTNRTSDPVMITITQDVNQAGSSPPAVEVSIATNDRAVTVVDSPVKTDIVQDQSVNTKSTSPSQLPLPFRLPEWEAAENSYLALAITNLNSITRSYNLMAPDLAKKPYFSLERELNSCYADVAPQLAEAIKQRAARPEREFVEKIGHRPGSILDKFGKDSAKIHDSKRPLYGWKEFWTDLFSEKKT